MVLLAVLLMRDQHRLKGMWYVSKNKGGVRNDINFKGGVRNKTEYLDGSGICSFWLTGCGIVLRLTARWGMKNRKSQVADITQRIATITWRDRDKHSLDDGIEPKSAAGCGIKKRLLGNTQQHYRVTKTSQASLSTGQEWRAEGRLIVDKYRKRQRWNFSFLRPRPHYAGEIWQRRFYFEIASNVSVHTTPEERKNEIIGHLGFVFEENLGREITWLSGLYRLRKVAFSKYFPSTQNAKQTFANSSGL